MVDETFLPADDRICLVMPATFPEDVPMKPTWLCCRTCLWAEKPRKLSEETMYEILCHWDGQDSRIENPDYWCNHWICAACQESWFDEHNTLLCIGWFKKAGVK